MAKKVKKNRSKKEQHIGGLSDLKSVRGKLQGEAKFSEGAVSEKANLDNTEYMARKRQLTNSGMGQVFSGRAVIARCDMAKPGEDSTAIQVPYKRAEQLLILDMLMTGKSPSVKHTEPTPEQVTEFMDELTVEHLNRIYSFEGNGYISPTFNNAKFTVAPYKI